MSTTNWQRPLRFDNEWNNRFTTGSGKIKDDDIEERRQIEMRHGGKHDGIQPIIELKPIYMLDDSGNQIEFEPRRANGVNRH